MCVCGCGYSESAHSSTDQLGLFRKYDHIGTAHGFEFHVQFISREEKVGLT